jgi:ferredoxin-NADP reductase
MLKRIDAALDGVTMYRLTLYVLLGLLGVAVALGALGLRTVYTLTDQRAVPASWPGARGRIDAQMIQTAVPDYRERTFYLSGPPEMVNEHERALRGLGVRRRQIKKDYFNGLV